MPHTCPGAGSKVLGAAGTWLGLTPWAPGVLGRAGACQDLSGCCWPRSWGAAGPGPLRVLLAQVLSGCCWCRSWGAASPGSLRVLLAQVLGCCCPHKAPPASTSCPGLCYRGCALGCGHCQGTAVSLSLSLSSAAPGVWGQGHLLGEQGAVHRVSPAGFLGSQQTNLAPLLPCQLLAPPWHFHGQPSQDSSSEATK